MNLLILFALLLVATNAITALIWYQTGATAGEKQIDSARKMRDDILDWIALNWADEEVAFKNGHAQGYSQGLAQADQLYARHDA